MADTVRYLLEEMVPELEALEQRGYFSRSEIRAIVQKRQDFEYALKRMAARKEDYLRYIAYESQLDELREARRISRAISGKRGLAEWCITRRVHFIYERATRKFRGDLGLWSRWLRFCHAKRSSRQMSRTLTKALALHSGCAALWTYAAAWELEQNLNAGAARALMQRGLRMCKHAPELWHEYFRMELLYALRLRERRRVLGIADGDDDQPSSNEGQQAAAAGTQQAEAEAEAEEAEGGDESAAAVAAVLNGAVAGVVYRSAIAAEPHSVSFRRKFLELLQPLPHFPGKAALEAAVYDSVARDFAGSPEAWDLRARRHTLALSAAALPAEHLAGVQAAVGVYEEGLRAAPSSELVAALLAFLQQQLRELDECSASGGSSPAAGSHEEQQQRAAEVAAAAEWLRLRSQRAYEEAWADGLLTEALRLDNISFLLHQGEVEPALAAARQAVKALPQSAALWQQLIVLQAQISAEQLAQGAGQQAQQEGAQSSDEEEDAVMVQPAGAAAAAHRSRSTPSQQRLEGLVVQALQAVPAADAVPVWLTAITVLCGNGCSLEGLCRQMVQAALRQARGPVEGGLGAAAAALLTALHQAGGIEAARGLYTALLPLPPPGGDYFRCLLRLEMAQVSEAAPAAPPPRKLQDLFDVAAAAYGAADVQLWLLYCEWQASRGTAGDVAGVYWRARKALGQAEAFEAAYLIRFKLQPSKAV
ncbi:hypothetical protein D9Q98_000519 [Chlorella vulgaris]|uniref:U3 small nucleolar RNA-associated protein 6 N-terminal domain-containing protein n=1 Tax=Chlorella vulgaris TaxID=3077 RepID=A0A9D4TYJ1_CHLVU|nr:hypothetical protein D9Q98_000519 [Chlorella vulgaris]